MPSNVARQTLAGWRKANRVSQGELASRLSKLLGRSIQQQNVHQWESGVMPGADVAEGIRKLTGGAVTGESYGRRERTTSTERNRHE